ncbi:MAG: hypothetical protein CM15mP39_01750 [Synechococcus sp.]|nr:MAG: hypothetical protein CM15mP39_01750 [Synechococcus sp.]
MAGRSLQPPHDGILGHQQPFLCALVQTLINLRRHNQALALGSHHTAWINDDFYLYTRNFRDSAVMVMLNKRRS